MAPFLFTISPRATDTFPLSFLVHKPYIENFKNETKNFYTKEWMTGISFEEAIKMILDKNKKRYNPFKVIQKRINL